MFRIKNHKLYYGEVPVDFYLSPNRGKEIVPRFIILHYTATSGFNSPFQWLRDPKSKVSAHLLIGKDGKVVQLVPFNVAAWHAGKSQWNDLVGMNSYSIGIEMVNNGNEPFPEKQVETVLEICKAIMNEYEIDDILGHQDVAPGRKFDPGKFWKMKEFKERLGFKRYLKRGDYGEDVKKLQRKLQELGLYSGKIDGDFGPKTEAAVKEFQKRKGQEINGIISLDLIL